MEYVNQHSVMKGKFAEVRVFRHLLGKGYEVYIPIVDTGVDFVIEPPEPGQHKFVGIQVKTSKYQRSSEWWSWSVYKDDRRKNSAFFYVLCFDDIDKLPENIRNLRDGDLLCFIVPYTELDKELSAQSNAWTNKGEFNIFINRQSLETGRSKWLSFLKTYLNDWDVLK